MCPKVNALGVLPEDPGLVYDGAGNWAAPTGGGVPTGIMAPYGGDTAPSGWLLCDGASYLREDYAALFAALGVKYGAADGTHFNVPDRRGRVSVGKDASQTEFDVVGKIGGAKTHVLTLAEIPAHAHVQNAASAATGPNVGSTPDASTNTSVATGYSTAAAGGGQPHNNLPPYGVDNWIIKA